MSAPAPAATVATVRAVFSGASLSEPTEQFLAARAVENAMAALPSPCSLVQAIENRALIEKTLDIAAAVRDPAFLTGIIDEFRHLTWARELLLQQRDCELLVQQEQLRTITDLKKELEARDLSRGQYIAALRNEAIARTTSQPSTHELVQWATRDTQAEIVALRAAIGELNMSLRALRQKRRKAAQKIAGVIKDADARLTRAAVEIHRARTDLTSVRLTGLVSELMNRPGIVSTTGFVTPPGCGLFNDRLHSVIYVSHDLLRHP